MQIFPPSGARTEMPLDVNKLLRIQRREPLLYKYLMQMTNVWYKPLGLTRNQRPQSDVPMIQPDDKRQTENRSTFRLLLIVHDTVLPVIVAFPCG